MSRGVLKSGLRKRLRRLRHFRGHGVHSPFVYRLVREVFMRRTLILSAESGLLSELSVIEAAGAISQRTMTELYNIYIVCGYNSFAVEPTDLCGVDYAIVSRLSADVARKAATCGTTIVVLSEVEDGVVGEHLSTIVERKNYLILFNNHLPKQHFVL